MMTTSTDHWLQRWGGAVLAILICEGVGALASLATQSSVSTWYPALEKPFFTPPGWVFAPVWITLYALMGLAAWLVGRRGWATPGVPTALGFFVLQLVLNGAWSFAFFGARSPAGGLAVIVVLWFALMTTTKWFFELRRVAGWLLVPYLLWVSYAAALNGAIWWMN
jgi:tryptophan-rich sensory protein